MLAKKPADRYQTPSEAGQALKPFATGAAKAKREAAPPGGAGLERLCREAPAAVAGASSPCRRGPRDGRFAVAAAGSTRPRATSRRLEKEQEKRKGPSWKVYGIVAAGLATIALLSLAVLTFRPAKGKKAVVPASMETATQVAAAGSEKPPVRPEDASVKAEPVKPRMPDRGPPIVIPPAITNSIGMTLVRIPPGKFTMGSPKEEEDRGEDEEQHEVEIRRNSGWASTR